MAGTVTGEDAAIWLKAHAAGTSGFASMKAHTIFAISDFSLTMDRSSVEQSLLGQPGNYFTPGALSMDGSLTNCRFGTSGNTDLIHSIVDGTGTSKYIAISGHLATDDGTDVFLKWALISCQVTGYDITIGDADTITEASIDFVVLDPYNVSCNSSYSISDA